jgi:hypothetical protein
MGHHEKVLELDTHKQGGSNQGARLAVMPEKILPVSFNVSIRELKGKEGVQNSAFKCLRRLAITDSSLK